MSMAAQPSPGSIVTHTLPIAGPSVIDTAGNVYTTTGVFPGQSLKPTPGAAQTQPGGGLCPIPFSVAPCSTAFIAKSNASGRPVFATYLGGRSASEGDAIAIDAAGNVYVAGTSGSSFPTTPNAAISASASGAGFAAKLSADGSNFIYSTFLPPATASVTGIAIDSQGCVYVVGQTITTHAYVVKVSADGSAILYMNVLGGTNKESATSVVVNSLGEVVVTGYTTSRDFPVSAGVFQSTLNGTQNGFITKFDPSGQIVLSTFLGGTDTEVPKSLQLDSSDNIYVVGFTKSLDFPTTAGSFLPTPLIPLWSRWPGGFLAKLAPDGAALLYSTYVPTDALGLTSVSFGPADDVYVVGQSGPGLPVTASAPQPCAGSNGFVAHFDEHGALLDSTFGVGSTANDPTGFSLLPDGAILVASDNLAQVRFGAPGWKAAACLTPAVLSAATFGSGVVPGEFLSLVGSGIGPEVAVSASPSEQGTPVTLGGVQVFFDEKPAPIVYAQSTQVNFQAPFELKGQTQTTISLEYAGLTFPLITVPVGWAAPGLFRLQPNTSAQAYAVNADGTFNGPSNPAPRGTLVSFWGTGFGPTTSGCAAGSLNAPGPVNLAPPLTVVMDGGGSIQYAGGAPTLPCGVTQINMFVPMDAQPGALLIFPWVGMPFSTGIGYNEDFIGSYIYVK